MAVHPQGARHLNVALQTSLALTRLHPGFPSAIGHPVLSSRPQLPKCHKGFRVDKAWVHQQRTRRWQPTAAAQRPGDTLEAPVMPQADLHWLIAVTRKTSFQQPMPATVLKWQWTIRMAMDQCPRLRQARASLARPRLSHRAALRARHLVLAVPVVPRRHRTRTHPTLRVRLAFHARRRIRISHRAGRLLPWSAGHQRR